MPSHFASHLFTMHSAVEGFLKNHAVVEQLGGHQLAEVQVCRQYSDALAFPIKATFFRNLRQPLFKLDSQGQQIEQWQLGGQILVGWEVGLQSFRQPGSPRILGDSHWLAHIAQRVLYNEPVAFLTKHESQTRLVLGLAQEIVHSRQIKAHFAGEFRLAFFDLEIDHDVTAQSQVVEQQVIKEVLPADLQWVLTSYEREALSELQYEIANVFDQTSLQIPLPHTRA
jgi:hypothetical protein